MTFEQAAEHLRYNKRLYRPHWGYHKYLRYELPPNFNFGWVELVDEDNYVASGYWRPSQIDVFARDWLVRD